MATTFNLELNKKPTRKNTYKILLRITQDRKHKRINTTVEINHIRDFNPRAKQGNWIRTSEPNHKVWNAALSAEIEEAKKAYRDLKEKGLATKELITSAIREVEVSSSFLVYAKQRTKDIYNEGGYRNYKKYNGFCNKLEAYLKTIKKTDLLFFEVTTSFLSRFEAFLHTLKNEKNLKAMLHPNTIAVTFNIFKALINRAIEIDKQLPPDKNPFYGFKYEKSISTTKDKLNEAEILLIENLVLPKDSLIWHCRNYFLFSFYLAGIRAGDLIQLRWRNITSEGRLEYRMSKTNKDRNIKLHQKANEILQLYYREGVKPTDYIFPLLDNDAPYAKAVTEEQKATLPPDLIVRLSNQTNSKNSLINKYLNKIADQAEINKHISMHIARHSFAKIAKDNKVDNNHLKNLLGHSNIKITEAYMGNFETEETDSVMASIFKKKEDPKEDLLKKISKMDQSEISELIKLLNNPLNE
ncbi:MAG TPA: site-specific integrase [Paludibacter sp.]|nr:site-specific integrase [Paludibacter sp.]